MATRTRKEEWIALGVVGGFLVLGLVFFLIRNFLVYSGPGTGGGSARPLASSPSAIEAETESRGPSEESEPDTSQESAEPESDWRSELAQELELSEEQQEVLEMISPPAEQEKPEVAEARKRTLQEFFTEGQRRKIEERLRRYTVDGYREELRKKGSQASTSGP